MFAHSVFRAGLVCLLAASFPGDISVRAASERETLDKIKDAWTQRRAAIKSFHYVSALEEVEKVIHGETDVFGRQVDPTAPVLDDVFWTTLSFSFDKNKFAYRTEGEQWSEIKQAKAEYLFRAVFDGKGNRSLIQHASRPMGTLNHRHEPDAYLTVGVHQKVFWLTFDPVGFFQRIAYDVNKMRIAQRLVLYHGQKCLEISLPRKSNRWKGQLYVDAQRSYLPIGFVTKLDGALRNETRIEYAENDVIGWVVSGWDQIQFDDEGDVSSRSNGTVLSCTINTALKAALFDLKFPVGTHVVEDTSKGKRYYIQMPDGSLKPIKEREYGAVSQANPL